MSSVNRQFLNFTTLAILACAIGCGGSDNQKAGGQLLVDGKPAPSGSIRFYPVGGGRLATAAVEADGRFVVSYRKPGDGLPVGEYKVAIFCEVPVGPEKDEEAIDGMTITGGGPAKTKPLVPRIYNEITTTPLRQTVSSSSEPQNFIFDIPSK